MVRLDLETLLVINGIVVVLSGLTFVINTAMRRSDVPGRIWSVSFIGGMLAALCYGIWAVNPDAEWILIIGNAAYGLVTGAIWSGARVFNGRNARFAVVLAGGGAVLVVSALTASSQGQWLGSLMLFPLVAVFGGLAGVECLRGRLRRNLNARIVAGSMIILAVFYAARTVVFAVSGPTSDLFVDYFSGQAATLLIIMFVVVNTISISILQAERTDTQALGDRTVGVNSVVGLLSASPFAQQWEDWLERAEFNGDRLEMVAVDIDSLPEMNTALGRDFGDDAITSVAQIVRHHAPTCTLIGHPGAGRFVIVMVVTGDEARSVASDVRDALVDEPIDQSRGIRATASFGVVDTDVFGYDLATLSAALDTATLAARSAGGNHIVVGRAVTATSR